MFAANFEYYRAGSVIEASRLLAQHPGARLLAGGHSLIPLLKLRLSAPGTIIDIGRISELRGIVANKGGLLIGALTTHTELAASPDVKKYAEALAEASGQVGDPAVRNRGTIGGNVAHADPASDPPIVLAALKARFGITGPQGQRTVEVSNFFQGLMSTALAENEILTSIEIPARQTGEGMAYVKFAHPASRYAVIGVAAVITLNKDTCSTVQVAVGGLVPRPTRASSVEATLLGKKLSAENINHAANQVSKDLGGEILGDVFASPDYRRAMAAIYVNRALSAAAQRTS